MTISPLFLSYFKKHSVLMGTLVGVVVFSTVVGVHVIRRNNTAATNQVKLRVPTAAASSFSLRPDRIETEGTLESIDQAQLRSQVSAPVERIFVKIGDVVSQGQLLVSLSGGDFAAQVAQAQAGARGAEARLAELKNGARPEDLQISQGSYDKAQSDLKTAYANAITNLNDAYVKSDDAIRKQIDPLFIGTDSSSAHLSFPVKDSQVKNDVEAGRVISDQELTAWRAELNTLSTNSSPTDFDRVFASSNKHIDVLRTFGNRLMDAVQAQTGLSTDTANTYRTLVTAARSSITGAAAQTSGQQQSIAASKTTLDRAKQELDLKKSGATTETIAAAQAGVDAAWATVRGLQAQYAKTQVRAPISGTIAGVAVHVGDLLTPGQTVASIVNVSGLQIKAFVAGADAQLISEGAMVTILNSSTTATISRVAPSIDPFTKKVEINALIDASRVASSTLVVGQSVSLSIQTNEQVTASSTTPVFTLPLSAVKIVPGSAFVYTVDEKNVVHEHAVTLGLTLGETVQVVSGLDANATLITQAYDLIDGQEVEIATNS